MNLYMNKFKKISPLLSNEFSILGFLSITCGIGTFVYSYFIREMNLDIALWLICFGLFCTGYRQEKNEEDDRVILRRYHAFRISFVLTIVIVLIISASFIVSNEPIMITGLHTLLIICTLFNLVYLIMKILERRNKIHIDNK